MNSTLEPKILALLNDIKDLEIYGQMRVIQSFIVQLLNIKDSTKIITVQDLNWIRSKAISVLFDEPMADLEGKDFKAQNSELGRTLAHVEATIQFLRSKSIFKDQFIYQNKDKKAQYCQHVGSQLNSKNKYDCPFCGETDLIPTMFIKR